MDSLSHLEYTDSCSSYQLCDPQSTVERANCDAQSEQIPLSEGLILQALSCSMLLMVNSALCLLCLALLLSVLSLPLRVHCSLSLLVAWTLLYSSSLNLHSTVSLHAFSHSISMHVRFLSYIRQFAYRLCTWSSLFGVSMNAREVATCPPSEQCQAACRFISLIMSWIRSFSTVAVNRFQIPLNPDLIPCRLCFCLSSAISAV